MTHAPTTRAAALCILGLACLPLFSGEARPIRAQEVTDKLCKRVVQPFKISDNVLSVVTSGVKEKTESLVCRLRGNCATGHDAERAMRERIIQSNWLPMGMEVKFGERAHALELDMVLERDTPRGQSIYAVADAMLAELTSQLGEEHPYELKLFVLKRDTRNAQARPGGFLYMDSGLLSDEEHHDKARFALAHELAHIFQRHETRAVQALIVDSLSTKDELDDLISEVNTSPESVLDRVQLEKDTYLGHQIDQELQADACSARILARAYSGEEEKATASISAFLKDLPAAETLPAPAPTSAPASAKTGSAGELGEIGVKIQTLVSSPETRHPSSIERVANLRIVEADVRGTK